MTLFSTTPDPFNFQRTVNLYTVCFLYTEMLWIKYLLPDVWPTTYLLPETIYTQVLSKLTLDRTMNMGLNHVHHVAKMHFNYSKTLVMDPYSFNQRSQLGLGHVGFVVDKVGLGQVFSKQFSFPCQFTLHRLLHNHHHLSSGAGTIGQTVAAVPSGLSLTPMRKIINKKKSQITLLHILKTYSLTSFYYYPLISFLVILMVIFQQAAL
jgi:hypothetical protein